MSTIERLNNINNRYHENVRASEMQDTHVLEIAGLLISIKDRHNYHYEDAKMITDKIVGFMQDRIKLKHIVNFILNY